MTSMTEKKKPSILIVEDERTLAKIYARLLEHEGYQVTLAFNGVEGIARLREKIPDLVLLDIKMPQMNGFEVMQEMQNDPRLRDVPVVILTVLGQDADREHGLSLGAKDYLVKTDFTLSEILTKVKKYLKKSVGSG